MAGNINKIEFQKTLKNTSIKSVTLTGGATITLTWNELGLPSAYTSSIVKVSTGFGANAYGLFFVMRGSNQPQTVIERLIGRNCSLSYNASGIILKNDSSNADDFYVTIC